MDDQLMESARDGNIESLYSTLASDPFILERVDSKPIAHTPLHVAAISGNTHFAMELATLKPSLARKLNHLGLSPIHLALENGNDQLVRSIVAVDPELLHVKSKGRFTPVHYMAAEIENVDLLAEFLSACPSCIEDLTSRCETVVHVAVKNKRVAAFKVLFGWLQRANREEILNWKDEDGNTILHIATVTNQSEVVKLVAKKVNKNAKNLSGLTAMDMFDLQRNSLEEEVGKILRWAKAKKASELANGSSSTLAAYLIQDLYMFEKRDKYWRAVGQNHKTSDNNDVRNIILVVAILIATATYQAVLSPPAGLGQVSSVPSVPNNTDIPINSTGVNDNISPPNNTNAPGNPSGIDNPGEQTPAGVQLIMALGTLFNFFTVNTVAFYASVFTIQIVIIGLPYSTILSLCTHLLLTAYYISMVATFSFQNIGISRYRIAVTVFISLIYIFQLVVSMVSSIAWSRYKKFKRRLDNPKRHMGGLI